MAQFIGQVSDSQDLCIVMDYAAGGDLQQLLNKLRTKSGRLQDVQIPSPTFIAYYTARTRSHRFDSCLQIEGVTSSSRIPSASRSIRVAASVSAAGIFDRRSCGNN
eukprot:6206703-Pleurochrysis_carterae.AAC.1